MVLLACSSIRFMLAKYPVFISGEVATQLKVRQNRKH